ncbi:group II intron reverse transcriptase/maturase [Desertivirga xinjiangensis]|uniref:group II intron reverse transcriptase/maturase n=1 Tax=Desertivirga xinjiangensis TaxID=539206 RepID=UPI00210E367D|nr:group II intron reverse transcriptase/maturase [Pedobacter xinjiangensis]
MIQKQETELREESPLAIGIGKLPEGVMSSDGVVPSVPLSETSCPERASLMERITNSENMRQAYQQVKRNKGAPGIDGMKVEELPYYLKAHWVQLKSQLETGRYQPQSVRKVEILKPGGGKRMLGIPTVVDRLIQQAIHQVLSPLWEPNFSEHSYGFRPGRRASDGVNKARIYQEEGYRYVVDIDLSKFFDEVNHSRLMSRLMERTPGEQALHRLVHRFLKAGIMEGGLVETREKGTPQGSPLSPLLSNIVLDELDKELEHRGHKFVRYADDCNIYVKKKRSGERVFASVSQFLEKKMRLKVNGEKSKVDQPRNRKFLGFSFYYRKGRVGIRISPESISRFRSKVKDLCRMGRGMNIGDFVFDLLNPYLQGWINYYRIGETKSTVEKLDEWIRRRLRLLLWRSWKRRWTRRNKLMERGLPEQRAVDSAFNGRGPWWNSGASHMNAAYGRSYFKSLKLVELKAKVLFYQKSLINGTAVCGTARTVV